jgi:hypothetical protein
MSDLQHPSFEVLPECVKCRMPMALKRLRAGRSFSYLGKFECETCGRTITEDIELRFGSSPPPAPVPTSNLTRAKRHAIEIFGLAAVLFLVFSIVGI